MRLPIKQAGPGPQANQNWEAIRSMLHGGLGLDNFNGRILEGTTAGSADTSKLFPHGMKPQPDGGIVVLGNVYIYDIDEKSVDIRSTQSSVTFRILLGYA